MMGEDTKVNGKKMKNVEKVLNNMQIKIFIRENFEKANQKDKEFIYGVMEKFTKVNGKKESKMEKEFGKESKENVMMVNGKMVKQINMESMLWKMVHQYSQFTKYMLKAINMKENSREA